MKQYRTAQGKIIDMSTLAAKHEKVRAVGNMKVNARGDTIDANGKIIIPVTQKVGESYQKTVGNKSAQTKKMPTSGVVESKKSVKAPLTEDEKLLEESYNDDLEVEQIKAKENKK
jgi:hypothetical protein